MVLSSKKKLKMVSAIPTRSKTTFSTRPPMISTGKLERQILRYMLQNENSLFNQRAYSLAFNISRSTVKDSIKNLVKKGFVKKEGFGCYFISKRGKNYISILNQSGGASGRVWRDDATNDLSVHKLIYKVDILNYAVLHDYIKNRFMPSDIKLNKIGNLETYYFFCDDATIILNKNKLSVSVGEVLGQSSDNSLYLSFDKALFYLRDMMKNNFVADTIHLEKPHFARVGSVFADVLKKYDNKYSLDLGDGLKFWIDASTDILEDECNNEEVRNRLDLFLSDAIKSNSLMSDVDKMKETIGVLLKLKVLESYDFNKLNDDDKIKGVPSYIG